MTRPAHTALHVDDCSGADCKKHKIDEARLVEWISQGKTPLVKLTDTTGMEYSAHDLNKEKVIPFVAVTHTWEEGIFDSGKDARNKDDRHMHSCQLYKLLRTCHRLLRDKNNPDNEQEIYLWIDFLCLPRKVFIRASAINQMKNIYSKAKTVLVWDRNLMQTLKTGSPIEMNLRIKMSYWAQRTWQEVVLGKNLHIQFEDDTVCAEEIQEARDEAKKNVDHEYHYVWKAGHPFSSSVWKFRQPREDSLVQRAWEAVQFRPLTEPEDEIIILKNILKLDDSSDDDNDLASVSSSSSNTYASSISSVASDGMTGLLDALEELTFLFLNDAEMSYLLNIALWKNDAEGRFVSKFRSLLMVYGRELEREAKNETQEAAAKLLQGRATYIAKRIQSIREDQINQAVYDFEEQATERGTKMENHTVSPEQVAERRARLRTLMDSLVQPSSQLDAPLPQTHDEVEDDDESDNSSVEEEPEINPDISSTSLKALADFMTSSKAFTRLRMTFWRVIFPNPLRGVREVMLSVLRPTKPALERFHATLKIFWPVAAYIATELGYDLSVKQKDHVLKSILTVTGYGFRAYANAAEAYVRWKWPGAKVDVLELVGLWLKATSNGTFPFNYCKTNRIS